MSNKTIIKAEGRAEMSMTQLINTTLDLNSSLPAMTRLLIAEVLRKFSHKSVSLPLKEKGFEIASAGDLFIDVSIPEIIPVAAEQKGTEDLKKRKQDALRDKINSSSPRKKNK